jgi:hypothetical protein
MAQVEKKAPVFKAVADLRPATHGHNLHVKVGLWWRAHVLGARRLAVQQADRGAS